jgi:hypothetical protein
VIVDPDSPPPDLPLRDAVVRLRSAYPASVLAGACFGIPIAIVAALLPDLLSWLGYGAALAFDSAAVLAASSRPSAEHGRSRPHMPQGRPSPCRSSEPWPS